jgi:hypothetical protein
MKEPHDESLANYIDPESCVNTRKGAGETLTGAHAGRILSREIHNNKPGAPTLLKKPEGNTGRIAIARYAQAPRGLRPRTCVETFRRDLGCPVFDSREDGTAVRIVNPLGVRR